MGLGTGLVNYQNMVIALVGIIWWMAIWELSSDIIIESQSDPKKKKMTYMIIIVTTTIILFNLDPSFQNV